MNISGHNIVNMLYVIRNTAESHLALAEEGKFSALEHRLAHAESALQAAQVKAQEALEVTRRIRILAAQPSVPGTLRARFKEPGTEVPGTESTEVTIPVAICASVLNVWTMVRKFLTPEINRKNAQVITRIPDNFPLIVCRSRALIEILFHLAHNALQALEDSEKLILRAEYGLSQDHSACAIITVADTGPGIPEHMIQNLFTPFMTTKTMQEGNGLGLSIVRELVLQNSGCLSVASSSSGTAFILQFPFQK